jgi:hypothetical protein
VNLVRSPGISPVFKPSTVVRVEDTHDRLGASTKKGSLNNLVLTISGFNSLTGWRWVLTDPDARVLGDHQVSIDPAIAEYQGFLNLEKFLWRRGVLDGGKEEREALTAFGQWLNPTIFGDLTRIKRA